MEKQVVTVVVILDLSAAFDTVDHDLLLEVLEKQYGIVGTARQWYTSYLKPRSFKVIFNIKCLFSGDNVSQFIIQPANCCYGNH